MTDMTRRTMLAGGAAALGFGLRPASAQSGELAALAAAAAKKGPVVWTESSSDEQINLVIAAFNKRYPDIKVQFVRNTGGNTLAARVVQEAQGGTAPAALLTGDHQQFELLRQRGLVVERDWKALGVDPSLTPKPHLVSTSAAMGILLWNKKNVTDANAPKNYFDLVDARWSGKVGSWVRAPNISNLAKLEGEARVREFVQKLVANKCRMYDSTYQLAQEVGSGEIDVGFGLYHTTMVPIKQGAPIGWAFTDPIANATIFSAVVNKGANVDGAQVLAAWLGTAEGANAYEAGTGRGNPQVLGSQSNELAKGRKLSEWSVDETPVYAKLMAEFNKMLAEGRGKG